MEIVIPEATWSLLRRESTRYSAFATFKEAWESEMSDPARLGDLYYMSCRHPGTPVDGIPTRLQNLEVIDRLINIYEGAKLGLMAKDGYMGNVAEWLALRRNNLNERAWAIGTPLKYMFHYTKTRVSNSELIFAEDMCCNLRRLYAEL